LEAGANVNAKDKVIIHSWILLCKKK
jgi:hypothetical protein